MLLAAGHTLGGRKAWSPQGENPVLQAMRTERFQVVGVSRTYLDFYLGFGFTLSVFLVLQAILLWQLATIAKTAPLQVRGMVTALAVASLASTLLSWRFLFAVPTAFTLVITVLLGLAAFIGR
jgi:hypothetical protein